MRAKMRVKMFEFDCRRHSPGNAGLSTLDETFPIRGRQAASVETRDEEFLVVQKRSIFFFQSTTYETNRGTVIFEFNLIYLFNIYLSPINNSIILVYTLLAFQMFRMQKLIDCSSRPLFIYLAIINIYIYMCVHAYVYILYTTVHYPYALGHLNNTFVR